MAEGYYLYCITGTGEARSYGPIGIGGRNDEVFAINYEDLSCVASVSPLSDYAVTRENLLAHQKVIEDVMKNHSVLPIRFSTIAKNVDDLRSVLRKRYAEFKDLQEKMKGKVEVGIKALWKDMKVVWKDIAEKDDMVKKLKVKAAVALSRKGFDANLLLGRAVRASLDRKKEEEAGKIISMFRGLAADTRTNKTHGDSMAVNAAFLVDMAQAAEFDRQVVKLDESGGNISLKYVGPVPPFNFISIVIEWD